ncbi:MAG: hypothetical protein FJ312_02345 [SAR202 cluster bacterium]|nr:hypothetical protein [SAR202 cluster bacterium]
MSTATKKTAAKTKSALSGKIQTVLGPIEPDQLGITMTHEHLLLDLTCYMMMPDEASERYYWDKPLTMDMLGNIGKRWMWNKDINLLLDERIAIEEVLKYRYAGGCSVVDTTSIGIARDPLALARISRATGLNVVLGASHYVPVSYPSDMDKRTEDQITEYIVRDIAVGVGDTGVKSGVIGEVGNFWPTSATERKVLRASARAQVETGAPILIHPGFHPDSLPSIIKDLYGAGADPAHLVMGHLDGFFKNMDRVRSIAETGCYLEYDVFGGEDTVWGAVAHQEIAVPSDVQRMECLEQLIEWGYLERIVIAQDVCFKSAWTRYGGKGFAHILENIVPRMRKRGFTQEQIDTILVKNPARVFAFK